MLIERRNREEIKEPLKVTGITLLSIKEYETAKEYVPLVNGWWWLRSPGDISGRAAYVEHYGRVNTYGNYVDSTDIAVRPALLILNLDSSNLNPGDRIVDFCGSDWTVISDNMVLCDTEVGTHCFREDWVADGANDYKKSDVKKWLENWARERGIIDVV